MVYKLKKGEKSPINGHLVSPTEWDTIQKALNYVVMDKLAHNRIKNITIPKKEVKV